MSHAPFIDPAKLGSAISLLETLTSSVWTRLQYSKQFGISQREETMTDTMMLDLKMGIDRLGITGMEVWTCSKRWEPHIGIDWMWTVGSPRLGWLRFAVQAKRLDLYDLTYGSFGHEVRPGIYQIDVLERYARWARATPLYSLYNHLDFGALVPAHCPTPSPASCGCLVSSYWRCCKAFTEDQFGCTVTHLSVVRRALEKPVLPRKHHRPTRRRFAYVHEGEAKTMPWRCLLCPNFMKLDPGENGNLTHPEFGEMEVAAEAPEDMRVRLADILNLQERDDIEDLLGMTVGPRMIMRIDVDQLGNTNLNPPHESRPGEQLGS